MVLLLTCMSGSRIVKRVDVVRVKVTKTDGQSGGWIRRSERHTDVLYRVLGKAPVIFGDEGCCHLLSLFKQLFSLVGTRKKEAASAVLQANQR